MKCPVCDSRLSGGVCSSVGVVGDVHGNFSQLVKVLDQLHEFDPSVKSALCVGDVEANRNARDAAGVATGRGHRRWVGEFPSVASGDLVLPLHVHFIGGEHEPWHMLDVKGPGMLAPNISFLGRAGVRTIDGFSVGFLSGVFGSASDRGLGDRLGRDERACYVSAELAALRRSASKAGRLDLLLTHDWPSGVLSGVGDFHIADLVYELEPALALCGHHHKFEATRLDTTPVLALPEIVGDYPWAHIHRGPDGALTVSASSGEVRF